MDRAKRLGLELCDGRRQGLYNGKGLWSCNLRDRYSSRIVGLRIIGP